jgi:hypothetical protein
MGIELDMELDCSLASACYCKWRAYLVGRQGQELKVEQLQAELVAVVGFVVDLVDLFVSPRHLFLRIHIPQGRGLRRAGLRNNMVAPLGIVYLN